MESRQRRYHFRNDLRAIAVKIEAMEVIVSEGETAKLNSGEIKAFPSFLLVTPARVNLFLSNEIF